MLKKFLQKIFPPTVVLPEKDMDWVELQQYYDDVCVACEYHQSVLDDHGVDARNYESRLMTWLHLKQSLETEMQLRLEDSDDN